MKSRSTSQSGVALVIVLGFLVILSALAVAFFSSVTTEVKSSRNFASGVTTRQLAESTTQIVMGQIRDATTRVNGAWASQPGMLRVYRTPAGVASNQADAFVKLYSAQDMVVSSDDLHNGTTYQSKVLKDYADDWNVRPAQWTDLNSPVEVDGEPHFPIIDPRAYAEAAVDKWTTKTISKNVEGFWYDQSAPVAGIVGPPVSAGLPGSPDPASAKNQRLPMPVRWMYVLQDGRLTVPNTSAGAKVEWTTETDSAPKPTKVNPIVGRVAFWTDDETSKVNLNTAGGFVDPDMDPKLKDAGYDRYSYAGSYWDTPRFYHEFDRGMPYAEDAPDPKPGTPLPGRGGLALCQLLQNEFQRYPGHPGTTSLGLIFGNFLRSEQLYYILPRIGTVSATAGPDGGSTEGGTKRIVPFNPKTNPDTLAKDLQIKPKAQRLYASVDELLFAADSTSAVNSKYRRQTNDSFLKTSATPLNTTAITPQVLDKLRFFLTAQSRAPEVNLFGQPRVSVWPVRFETATESSGLNPFDNVILFCSTVGSSPNPASRPNTMTVPSTTNPLYRYIFTRREIPVSTTRDLAGQITLPTAVTNWASASSWVPDAAQPRNKQVMAYLQKMTNAKIPGFGDDFKTKLGEDNRNNLLAEIFDYILCANLVDTTSKTIDGTSTAKKFAPTGVVMPSKPDYLNGSIKYTGFGRFPTISEASLVFYYAGPTRDAGNVNLAKVDATTGRPTHHRMGAFLLLSTFNPMQGFAPITDPGEGDPKMTFEIDDGLSKFKVNYAGSTGGPFDLGFPAKDPYNSALPLSTTVYRCSNSTWGGRNLGGFEGFMHTLVGRGTALAPHKIKGGKGATPLDLQYRTDPGTKRVVTVVGDAEALPKADSWNASSSKEIAQFVDSDVMNNQEWYQFQTARLLEIPVNPTGRTTFSFIGGDVNVTVKYGGREIQKIKLNFPSPSIQWPVPTGDPTTDPETGGPWLAPNNINLAKVRNADNTGDIDLRDVSKWMSVGKKTPASLYPIKDSLANRWMASMRSSYWRESGSFYPDFAKVTPIASPNHLQTTLQASWSFASRLAWSMQQSNNPYQSPPGTSVNSYDIRWKQIVQPGDTIRSVIYCDANNGSIAGGKSGDLRVLALASNSTSGFEKHPDYLTDKSRACLLRTADGNLYFPPNTAVKEGAVPKTSGEPTGEPAKTLSTEVPFGNHVLLTGTKKFPTNRAMGNLPNLTSNANPTINGVFRDDGKSGDFDTGTGTFTDGPYINKQDEGNVIYAYLDTVTGKWRYPVPYFDSTWQYEKPGNTFTSPSRQMPSAGMMGSLPRRAYSPATGASTAKGWETLSFSPNPAGDNHPGNTGVVKDHLLLDFFQMPVVEPYPISEPFSTAGKVNLNYRMAPFDYITRSTALRAALHPLRVAALDASSQYDKYKTGEPNGGSGTAPYDFQKGQNKPVGVTPYRLPVDRDLTVKAIDTYLDLDKTNPDTGFFKSATEICERYLYPIKENLTNDASVKTFWSNRTLGGDNVREKPYVDLYPRLTTKSNTYTVHMRVQTLRQLPRTTPDGYAKWEEGKDNVLGDYRGATTIERYIDPGDPRFTPGYRDSSNVDISINPDNVSVEPLYRFRSVINKKFSPN